MTELDYVSVAAFILMLLYVACLVKNSQSKHWRIIPLTGAFVIFVIGCVIHWNIISLVSEKDQSAWFTSFWISIVSTLELFVGATKMFENGVQAVLFGEDGKTAQSGYLIALTTVYISAIITTTYIIGMFIIRHFYSRLWLRKKKNKPTDTDEIYVLFGLNLYALNLIKDIRNRHSNAKILAVDYLTDDEKSLDISLQERVRDIFSDSKVVDGANIVLKAKKNLSQADPSDLCSDMGLRHLRQFLDNNANIYLLLDDQQENLTALNNLLEARITCSKIYCHARRDELNKEIEDAFHNLRDAQVSSPEAIVPEVVFIDSSFLSVRSLFRSADGDCSALPVNYVKIAHDDKGQNLGYVESGFKAMIIGFGETGQEALSFLYEFGAFVGKNKKKVPFECHVYDNKMNSILGYYSVSHPGMNEDEAGIHYSNVDIGSGEFWNLFESQIADTNYIVVSTGSDLNNLSIVKHIIQHLGPKDTSDRFRIMVRQTNPDGIMRKTLEFMSAKEHNCIKPFGMIDTIWRENVISDIKLTELAKAFNLNYSMANNDGKKTEEQLASEWDDRERLIHSVNIPRSIRLNEIRKRAQSFANCLNIPTKIALMQGPMLKNAKSIVKDIPGIYNGTLFNGDRYIETILDYMAIGEHLRWEASHVAMGYRRGKEGETTDAGKRVHEFIVDYTRLSPKVQHFDWLVIRTTLDLYSDGKIGFHE